MNKSILDVRGIGPAMQIVLAKHGYNTLAELANATVDELVIVPGLSHIKATQVLTDAGHLLSTVMTDENLTATKDKTKKVKTSKKLKKDKSKDKTNKDKKSKDKKKDKDKVKSKKAKKKANKKAK